MYTQENSTRRTGIPVGRLLVAAVIAIASLLSYFGTRSLNPVTQETQHIDITPDQEIAMGLQAAPEMEQEFGGEDPNANDQRLVQAVGQKIVDSSPARQTPYEFAYHLLADPQTVNAFALPGGQVFITRALYDLLTNEAELAGVLSHETGHVVARHSAEQIAKAKLTEGLTGAAVIASYDPNNPRSGQTAQMAILIGQLVNLKYSRSDELQADQLGVCFMNDAGYDPHAMIQVMEVLQAQADEQNPPEFLSTHPDPGHRIQEIQTDIQKISECPQ